VRLCQLRVGKGILFEQVVGLKQGEAGRFAGRGARLPEFAHGRGEQAANPLPFKKFFEPFSGRDRGRINGLCMQLAFSGGKIQRQVHRVAAALLTAGMLDFVQHKAVRTQTDVSAQAASLRHESRKQVALEEFCEESLGQVLRFLGRLRKFQSYVFIDRLPVRRTENVQSASAFGGIIAASCRDDRPTRGRKISAALHNGFFR
jgi:hypothetical protein